jgi:U3 small nucleolar RNA-associated protein 18
MVSTPSNMSAHLQFAYSYLLLQIHLPSLTAFANWPTSSTPLGHVTSIDFSAGSEYVAVGNNRGRVLLNHLRDFSVQ